MPADEGTPAPSDGKDGFLLSPMGRSEQLQREEPTYSIRTASRVPQKQQIPWIHHLAWDICLCRCLKSQCDAAVRTQKWRGDAVLDKILAAFEEPRQDLQRNCTSVPGLQMTYRVQEAPGHLQETFIDEQGQAILFRPKLDPKTWNTYLGVGSFH
ncbi:hypothetical protein K470DRAFT_289617 [Piedraia hortae CBS 480.64]|uniref:Uncharacterized protein n=1 Tax=Piedraia hortae CBS 480.64 TaxID=1314780 RepID=A0A6A7BST3_9PEZI|nr:hypothetical protein K470DRAFT_289617 [Piedraia hortae CBS 480.64]